jgi:hypothetical protein
MMNMDVATDLKSNYEAKMSNKEGALSGTTPAAGTGIDCADYSGPIFGLFHVEDASGSPTTQSYVCKLQESDAVGGTYTDCINMRTVTLTADNTAGFAKADRTKQFVKGVMTPAFTGGSSPANVGHSSIVGKKQNSSST